MLFGEFSLPRASKAVQKQKLFPDEGCLVKFPLPRASRQYRNKNLFPGNAVWSNFLFPGPPGHYRNKTSSQGKLFGKTSSSQGLRCATEKEKTGNTVWLNFPFRGPPVHHRKKPLTRECCLVKFPLPQPSEALQNKKKTPRKGGFVKISFCQGLRALQKKTSSQGMLVGYISSSQGL